MPRAVSFVLALALVARPAFGAPKADEPTVDDSAAVAAAREHFRKAVKLFEDQNFGGALAEFEAAYASKATASSLQNIALCLKALYRYAQAAETLDKLLERHASELSNEERAAVEQARDELLGLIGVVKLTTVPEDARVLFDGRAVTPEEREQGVRLDVGEHRVEVSAPGYAPETRILRIAASRTPRQERLVLRAVMGFIQVESDDPKAAIAVDGEPRGYQSQRIAVTPGQHTVQIYDDQGGSYERVVSVVAGQTVTVRGEPGDTGGETVAAPSPVEAYRGWYALLALTGLQASEPAPFDGGDSAQGSGIGIRGGFRPWRAVSFEILLDASSASAEGACLLPDEDSTECAMGAPERAYTIGTLRFGPNVRVNTLADKWRLFAAAGIGIAANSFTLDATDADPGAEVNAASGYFALELGGEVNFAHFVLGLALTVSAHGSPDLKLDGRGLYPDKAPLSFGGLSLRGGYSQWAPP